MCKKLLFLASVLVVLGLASNASAAQDYIWTDANGIANAGQHGKWTDPCNWLGSLTDPNFRHNVPGLNDGAKIANVSGTGGVQPTIDSNIPSLAYFQGGAVANAMVTATVYITGGGDLYLDKDASHGNKGDAIWGGTAGAPGTVEMTGGILSGFDNFQIGKRSKGILRMLSGDPLVEACNNGVLKLGNKWATGTGDSNVYLEDGTIYVDGMNWFDAETYMNITGGTLISGYSRLGFAGYPVADMEQYILDAIQGGNIECDGGAGEMNIAFSDPFADWVTVTCEARDPLCAAFASPKGKNITPYVEECPNPAGSATDHTLTWDPGSTADEHDVYMGTDSADVNNDGGSSQIGFGLVVANRPLTAPLDLGETYYWRVRESNSSSVVCHGNLWSIETVDCLCIDNFEGGLVGWTAEGAGFVSINTGTDYGDAVSGTSSLNINYGDTAGTTTTAKLIPVALTDWSVNGSAEALTFWYRAPANAEQIRVQLNGNAAQDISATLDACWHQANLTETALKGAGTGFSTVSTLRIIVMDDSMGSVTSDNAYIDDVGVCASRCVDATAPEGDFTGDCAVDGMDLSIMCADWLQADANIGPDNIDLNDTPDRRPSFVSDGTFGTVLEFDGTNDYFGFDKSASRYSNFHDKTVSVWVKRLETAVANEATGQIVTMYGSNPKYRIYMGIRTSTLWQRIGDTMSEQYGTTVLTKDTWYHVAWVFQDSCAIVNGLLYLDGALELDTGEWSQDTNTQGYSSCWIGGANTKVGVAYVLHAQLAEFKIFDYALTEAEVDNLAGTNEPNVPPDTSKLILSWDTADSGLILKDKAPLPHYGLITSPANISDTEAAGLKAVNFKDYAKMANNWGVSATWP